MYQKDPENEQRPSACIKNDIARDGDSKRWSGCLREAETGDFGFAMVALVLKAINLFYNREVNGPGRDFLDICSLN